MRHSSGVLTVAEQIADVSTNRPHLVLLGAGASRAALPNGDKHGRPVPLLRDVAEALSLKRYFPHELQDLAVENFEAAYSRLFDAGPSPALSEVDRLVRDYFSELELPDEPNLYDVLNLSMRRKDVIGTFNWDPFLLQSRIRLDAMFGIGNRLPLPFFLHGNVMVGYCPKHNASGVFGRRCSKCLAEFEPSRLLYPVEHKDYQSDPYIQREWLAIQSVLKEAKIFTVFGYSAPVTDKQAVDLLKEGWGDVEERNLEQTEIINRPGSDEDELRRIWDPFIHSHHYEVRESFYDSYLGIHPRRSVEAWINQFIDANFLEEHRVPEQFRSFGEMLAFFEPLLEAEKQASPHLG